MRLLKISAFAVFHSLLFKGFVIEYLYIYCIRGFYVLFYLKGKNDVKIFG